MSYSIFGTLYNSNSFNLQSRGPKGPIGPKGQKGNGFK